MANGQTAESKIPSLEEVALSLIASKPGADDADETPEQSGDTVEPEDNTEAEEGGEAEDETTPEQSGDDPDADEQGQEDAGEAGYVDIQDDDLIEVTIDGQPVEMTIAQLKKAASGEGAIEKRLQQATEKRKEADVLHSQRTQALEALAQQERDFQEAIADLDTELFQPLISAPSAALKASDPARYQRLKDAYDKDQGRITAARTALQKKLDTVQTKRAERLQAYGADAAKAIFTLIPELGDKEKAPHVLRELQETAIAYGYTEGEIQNALDPRMFHLVRDAAAYRKLIAKNKETRQVTDLKKQTATAPRRLRSGGPAMKGAATAQKASEKARDRAKQTGKPDDVAAFLLKPKPKGS